ncbi:DUF2510 domain-containing protein [Pseudolysinimonas sp.]|uniref:DUF2510 domain-containing protein n=1 Tax=Pseudolysinimonas sp. TaxID=2680009 RepID=UPI00286B2C5A|nr:DUF2510 domain-containing protein [Pseudolysinimonas sp.]
MSDDDVRVPAGWYPDPLGLPQLRWWDNHSWTEHTSDARQPMVADSMTAQPVQAQPLQAQPMHAQAAASPRLAFADDRPFADDLADFADLESTHPVHDLVEPSTATDVTNLPSRRTLRDAERIAHDDDAVHDLTGENARFGEPLPELEAPARGNHVVAEPSPAVRYATAAGIDDAPRSMRYDLDERHEDLLGEPSIPRSAFAHATSSTTTFIPDYPAEFGTQTQTQAGSSHAHGSHRARLTHAPHTSTVPGWLLTLIPVYMLLVGMIILLSGAQAAYAQINTGIVLGVPWLVGIVLAVIDYRNLKSGGMQSPAHWAWALLGAPSYLVARLVATVRETGTGFGPVLTYLVLTLFMGGAVVAVPGLVMELAPAFFSVEAERSVTADARSLGAELTIDCPETPPLLLQQSFTCRAVNNEGRSFDVLVSLQRANGWIEWRVDNWGVFTMGS